LGFEYFRHDERKHALIGERSGTTYHMGASLTVKLEEAAPLTGGLRFSLVGAKGGPTRENKPQTSQPQGRFGKKSKQSRRRK
jgi:ribonuclease R